MTDCRCLRELPGVIFPAQLSAVMRSWEESGFVAAFALLAENFDEFDDDGGIEVDVAAFRMDSGRDKMESSVLDPLICRSFNELDIEPGRGTAAAEEPPMDADAKPLETVPSNRPNDS